jgi:hypothetical protein
MLDEPMEGRLTFAISGPIENLWAIEHWINIEAVQLLVHHASAVVAAIVIFALVARLAIWLLPHGMVRKVVVVIDDIVLILLLIYFGWDMLVYLWNRRPTLQPPVKTGAAFDVLEAYLPPSIAGPLGEIARVLVRLIAAPW